MRKDTPVDPMTWVDARHWAGDPKDDSRVPLEYRIQRKLGDRIEATNIVRALKCEVHFSFDRICSTGCMSNTARTEILRM